jgi:hypothetical protein
MAAVWAVVFVLADAALRLSYPGDIEFKSDERGFFEQAHAIATGAPWPWLGPTSSVGPRGPAMTTWILGFLAWLTHAATPPDLARAVQVLSIAGLAVFAGFAATLKGERRTIWLAAAALWAVNPVAIILERKIWNPSLMPLPATLFIIAWLHRRRPWAAFAWGVLGALLTQIHPGAAFLVVSLAAWTVARDRAAFPWAPWIAGSLLGGLTAIPWLMESLSHRGAFFSVIRFPILSFYVRFFTQPFGFGADYALGKAFPDFLAWPRIGEPPTYLVAALHVVLGAIAIAVLGWAAQKLWRVRAGAWRALVAGADEDGVLIAAAFWGYGGLLTLITIGKADSHRHYLELIAPVMALWCARLVLGFRGAVRGLSPQVFLPVLCAAQLAVSASLLAYIDQRQVIPGDYGVIWRAQPHEPPAAHAPRGSAKGDDRLGGSH